MNGHIPYTTQELERLHDARLRVARATARQILAVLRGNDKPEVKLATIAARGLLKNARVARVRSFADKGENFRGLTYLDRGKVEGDTIIFDHGTGRWCLGTIAGVVERQPGRFEL